MLNIVACDPHDSSVKYTELSAWLEDVDAIVLGCTPKEPDRGPQEEVVSVWSQTISVAAGLWWECEPTLI